MNSIQFHSSFSSLLSHPQHNNQQFNTHRLLTHSPQELATSRIPKLGLRMPYIKSRAAIFITILAETETLPTKGGDLSVLLPTGGLMLFIYFITNYVVPAFIIRSYESEDETEDSVTENGGD